VPAVLYDVIARETIANERAETLHRAFAAPGSAQALVDVLRTIGRRFRRRRRRPQLVHDAVTKRARDRRQGFEATGARGHARSLETSGFRVTASFREAEDTPAAALPRNTRA
jgi:ribosomal protein L4